MRASNVPRRGVRLAVAAGVLAAALLTYATPSHAIASSSAPAGTPSMWGTASFVDYVYCFRAGAVRVYHPSDPAIACVWNNRRIEWCDRHVDGHRVRAHYFPPYPPPNGYRMTAWAPSQNCANEGSLDNIAFFRVCVETEGCSGWKEV
jgi:hypothetical protein